ncbi:hypothetical protein MYOV011v1_p0338 [Vibrio phage 6E35.1a]|nr:hypothetical protein MYOV011v1_p0338 [Vibrio phage 6E35.1a]
MQYTVDFLNNTLEDLKSQQLGWVVSRNEKADNVDESLERVDGIIAALAVKITSLEHDLAIIKASRGLNAKYVKNLVDNHYRLHHNLDENDNFIDEAK